MNYGSYSWGYQYPQQYTPQFSTNGQLPYPGNTFSHHVLPVPQQTHRNLEFEKCRLEVLQQPEETALTISKKEKSRKPVDPPPVLKFFVDDAADPQKLFMNSPNLFCVAHLIHADNETPYKLINNEPTLIGNLCSSIHRLKDLEGTEFGLFIFGDISVRVGGTWRLMFTVFDIQKDAGTGFVKKLASMTSGPFVVHSNKDYKGLQESTHLTRTLSEQGVRLRLRKEARTGKRKADEESPDSGNEDGDKRQRYDDYNEPQMSSYAGPVQPPAHTPQEIPASPLTYTPYQTNSLQSSMGYYQPSQAQSHTQADFLHPSFRTTTSGISSSFGSVGGLTSGAFGSSPFATGGAVGGGSTDPADYEDQLDAVVPPTSRYQERVQEQHNALLTGGSFNGLQLNGSHLNGSHLNGSHLNASHLNGNGSQRY